MRRPSEERMSGHVVVTGASRGVGAAIARAFACAGAKVTVVTRNAHALNAVADEIGASAVAADLGDPAALEGLVSRCEATYGPVDVLVNNAALAWLEPVAAMGIEHAYQTIDVNLRAPVELVRQVLPGMLERSFGSVVNICSIGGISAFPTLTLYGATKSALSMFTTGLQREIAGSGVTAAIVLLGEVADTGMNELAHASPSVDEAARRLARIRVLPVVTAEQVGARIVDAVIRRKTFVGIPRGVGALEALRVLPTRLTDAFFTGIART